MFRNGRVHWQGASLLPVIFRSEPFLQESVFSDEVVRLEYDESQSPAGLKNFHMS